MDLLALFISVGPSASNVVFAVTCSKRWRYDHPVRIMIDRIFGFGPEDLIRALPFTGTIQSYIKYFSWQIKIPSKISTQVKNNLRDFKKCMDDITKEREGSPVNVEDPRDFVEAYKAECILKKQKGESTLLDGMYTFHY